MTCATAIAIVPILSSAVYLCHRSRIGCSSEFSRVLLLVLFEPCHFHRIFDSRFPHGPFSVEEFYQVKRSLPKRFFLSPCPRHSFCLIGCSRVMEGETTIRAFYCQMHSMNPREFWVVLFSTILCVACYRLLPKLWITALRMTLPANFSSNLLLQYGYMLHFSSWCYTKLTIHDGGKIQTSRPKTGIWFDFVEYSTWKRPRLASLPLDVILFNRQFLTNVSTVHVWPTCTPNSPGGEPCCFCLYVFLIQL